MDFGPTKSEPIINIETTSPNGVVVSDPINMMHNDNAADIAPYRVDILLKTSDPKSAAANGMAGNHGDVWGKINKRTPKKKVASFNVLRVNLFITEDNVVG